MTSQAKTLDAALTAVNRASGVLGRMVAQRYISRRELVTAAELVRSALKLIEEILR